MFYFSPLKVFFWKGSYFVISNLFYIYFLKLWNSSLYNKWSSTVTPQPLNPWVSPSQLLTCITYLKASMFSFILLCQHTMSFSTFSSYENVINHSKCSLETDWYIKVFLSFFSQINNYPLHLLLLPLLLGPYLFCLELQFIIQGSRSYFKICNSRS